MLRCQAQLVRKACCCPAFLIGMAGPNIIVSGAIFADRFAAHVLTDYISDIPRLGSIGRSPLDDAGYRVARLFRALRICIQELNEYYSRLVKSMELEPRQQRDTSRMNAQIHSSEPPRLLRPPHMIGPHFTTYKTGEDEVVLEYTGRLESSDMTRALFLADARRGSEVTKVVVKFTYKYGEEGHKLLAEVSQAPKLHHARYEDSVAMWVVVMDYVQGQEVQDVLTDPVHIASLRAAVTRLHDHGLVFGDLRRPSLLIVEDRVMLVGFDWCGKENEARYPSDILDTTNWHSGVQPGAPILKEHDEHFFRLITKQELTDSSYVKSCIITVSSPLS